MLVALSPAIRILPPSYVLGDRWVAEDLVTRRRFNLNSTAAAILVMATEPRSHDQLVAATAQLAHPSLAPELVEQYVAQLMVHRLLLTTDDIENDQNLQWLQRLVDKWDRANWREASEYHALTVDYPCVDYSEASAMRLDHTRMRNYQHDQPDVERFKTAFLDYPGQDLPEPHAVEVPVSAADVWCGKVPGGRLTKESLMTIIALAFGITDERAAITDAAPLLRRTSPSGGARHPSEGYVLSRHVEDVPTGWHHITIKPLSLRYLRRSSPTAQHADLFSGVTATLPDPQVVVVLSTVFERNMYRYREPRTFRTVHMDAGHIAGTIRLTAHALGLSCAVSTDISAAEIEEELGLEWLQEGCLVAVGLASGVPVEASSRDSATRQSGLHS